MAFCLASLLKSRMFADSDSDLRHPKRFRNPGLNFFKTFLRQYGSTRDGVTKGFMISGGAHLFFTREIFT